jgi:hypothetical protein
MGFHLINKSDKYFKKYEERLHQKHIATKLYIGNYIRSCNYGECSSFDFPPHLISKSSKSKQKSAYQTIVHI